jgi:hypothetical protein
LPEPTVTPFPPTPTQAATETPESLDFQGIVTISVPEGTPPTIDGVMDEGEWDKALVKTAGDGSDILIKQAEGILYVGIRSNTPEMIVGNVHIASEDTIRIMHASAALGTAVYTRSINGWEQQQAFNWRCRSTSSSEAAQAERAVFLEDEGWVAANSRIGKPNELEYHIVLPETSFQLAVNILRSSNPAIKVPYPADLDDDVILPTPGGLPATMHFTPETWLHIAVESS